MHASNKPSAPSRDLFGALPPDLSGAVERLWHGAAGWTVRCTPTRRTVRIEAGPTILYGKWRIGRTRDAANEWAWLHRLPELGLRTAAPIVWLREGRRTLLVTSGVGGRALDDWANAATDQGWFDDLVRYACSSVAPAVRRLHEQGLVYRDLYWNHVFTSDPRRGHEPVFLDVERVFRPRWRRRRWIVKDLAGLLASVPVPVSTRVALRFLRAYLCAPLAQHRSLAAAIVRKSTRIVAHAPRFG